MTAGETAARWGLERVPGWHAQRERWEAFAAANEEAELEQDDGYAYGMTVRGRVAPGMPWTGRCWSMERVLGELEAVTAERPGTVYDWEAGPASGACRSLAAAFRAAAGHLDGGGEGTVLEARVATVPAGAAGKVPVHSPTGLRWRGRPGGGVTHWRRA